MSILIKNYNLPALHFKATSAVYLALAFTSWREKKKD
jgi:hypothetical protein